jgi:hypothetical protein
MTCRVFDAPLMTGKAPSEAVDSDEAPRAVGLAPEGMEL